MGGQQAGFPHLEISRGGRNQLRPMEHRFLEAPQPISTCSKSLIILIFGKAHSEWDAQVRILAPWLSSMVFQTPWCWGYCHPAPLLKDGMSDIIRSLSPVQPHAAFAVDAPSHHMPLLTRAFSPSLPSALPQILLHPFNFAQF